MEDPIGDWEIVTYPSSEDAEIAEKSGNSSKLEWIVNTGLSLGKKAVVAGFVITSVPVLLPPLAVVSALGIASSVPFGLMLASYACTESLMSKLLPHPPPSQDMDGYDYDYVALDEDNEKNGDNTIDPVEGGQLSEETRGDVDVTPQREDETKDTGDGIDEVVDRDEAKEVSVVVNGEEIKDKSVAAEEHENKQQQQQQQQQQSVSRTKSNSSKKKKKAAKKLGLSEKEAPVKNKDTVSLQEEKKAPVETDSVKEDQRKEVAEGSSEQRKVKATAVAAAEDDENRESGVEKQKKEKAVSEERVAAAGGDVGRG